MSASVGLCLSSAALTNGLLTISFLSLPAVDRMPADEDRTTQAQHIHTHACTQIRKPLPAEWKNINYLHVGQLCDILGANVQFRHVIAMHLCYRPTGKLKYGLKWLSCG